MKKLLFAGFLVLGFLAIGIQIEAITDSKKVSDSASAQSIKKASSKGDLVYYRSIFFANKAGC
jgi:hypothetical protein